jgi:hypothetical protein
MTLVSGDESAVDIADESRHGYLATRTPFVSPMSHGTGTVA